MKQRSPIFHFKFCFSLIGILFTLKVCADEQLPELLAQRLLLMKDVAAYKWHKNLPIEDKAREAQVIATAEQQALTVGLTRGSSRRLFAAQISAAKEIQNYWFQRWEDGTGLPPHIPDLETDLRPRLLELGRRITTAADSQYRDEKKLNTALAIEGLSAETRSTLISSVQQLQHYPNRLAQILDTGVLRVGTTADYPPFTFSAKGDNTLEGIDIEMARDLGNALGVNTEFVHTTWPNLMSDLKNGQFDIAMGGVSRTLVRQRHGFFSIPYHAGGKTILARCVDSKKFSTLEDVDRNGINVIVNPGGTNERFVDSHITHAQKILYPDNRTIFDALAAGRADVMITDRIEASWQASQHRELCLTTAKNLTYQEKAYLMPQDIHLKLFVDTWLELRITEGKLSNLVNPPPGHQ